MTDKHYFVDESGDPGIFTKKGIVNVNLPGNSKYFMLGFVDIENPKKVNKDLETIRSEILLDPYFKGIPSLQPDRKKTAIVFHAKDDIPEIRERIFRYILKENIKFSAVLRDKTDSN